MPLPEDISRPAVLYVERVETQPDIDAYLQTRRLSVIDIELTTIHAAEIAKYLQEQSDGRLVGSIRLRFTGRLIHL